MLSRPSVPPEADRHFPRPYHTANIPHSEHDSRISQILTLKITGECSDRMDVVPFSSVVALIDSLTGTKRHESFPHRQSWALRARTTVRPTIQEHEMASARSLGATRTVDLEAEQGC